MPAVFMFAAAVLSDFYFGDPQWRLHPVRLIGDTARLMEQGTVRLFGRSLAAGAFAWTAAVAVCMLPPAVLLYFCRIREGGILTTIPYVVSGSVILAFSFAYRDLLLHVRRVEQALAEKDLVRARQCAAWLVSRETEAMDHEQVVKAALESLAENFLDSVIAPFFYFLLFGPLGAWGFRVINTLDSMWGYRNAQYHRFGTCAARMDDLCGLLPARLSVVPMLLAALLPGYSARNLIRVLKNDRGNTDSPNSGWPESAAAGAVGVELGGEVTYFGKTSQKPRMGTGTADYASLKRMVAYIRTAYLVLVLIIGSVVWFSASLPVSFF